MSVKFKDYYKVLGVTRTASDDEIKKSYRKFARRYHPDVNPNDKGAEEKFKDLQEAYEVLGDKTKRKRYDQLGANWKHGAEFTPPQGWQGSVRTEFDFGDVFGPSGGFGSQRGGFSDFFESIFGQMAGGQTVGRGANQRKRWSNRGKAETELYLPIELMHHGTTQKLNLTVNSKQKTVDVRIPPGAKDGSRIRVPGGNIDGGDFYLRLKVQPGSRFRLMGSDTEVEIPISPWEAALGATVEVPTVEGTAEIKIPPGVGSVQRLRLKNQGMNRRNGGRGDHYVRLKIVVPKDLSPEERRHFEELAKSSAFRPRD